MSDSPITRHYFPRLSEAAHMLPLLRRHLESAASRYPLPTGLSVELLPIVDDGLFGYEVVPDRAVQTYLTVGSNAWGEPTLRRTAYGAASIDGPRLVASNGAMLPPRNRTGRLGTRQRETRFAEWEAAAEAVMVQILAFFPDQPRRPITLSNDAHRSLDAALETAYAHLRRWNPCVHFGGLPDEAQQGFALKGGDQERGELVFQRPDIWMLRWKTPAESIYESWSVALPTVEQPGDVSRGDRAS